MSIFSLFAIYSKTYSYTKLNEYYSDELKTYTLSLDDKDTSDSYSDFFDEVLDECKNIEQVTTVLKKPNLTYAYYLYSEKQAGALYFGSYFEKDTFKSSDKIVVAGSYNRTNDEISQSSDIVRNVGDEYIIDDEVYSVIGCTMDMWDEISYYSLNEKQIKNAHSIQFVFKDFPSDKEVNSLITVIDKSFPNSEFIFPENIDDDDVNRIWETVASLSISILAVLTLSYLLRYILELRKKFNAVCLIVGLKKEKIIFSIFCELLLSTSLIYLISSVLFKFIFSKIMLNLNIIMFEIGIQQYLYLYFVYMACIVVILGLCIVSSVNKSAKELYRRNC